MVEAVADEETRQFVLFRLGEEEYGLPISNVSSIIRYEPATPVPHAPDEVEGVISLRGRIVPVVDMRRQFSGVASAEDAPYERIVVTESDAGQIGLAVDSANEVATIPVAEIRPAPEAALTARTAEAVEGVASYDERLVVLLRLEHAIPTEEYGRLSSGEGEEHA
jgi:purine-binding chemotaxis protein CheW